MGSDTWLIACEFSGVVRDAFLKRGIMAMSCDLLPSEKRGPHIQGDVRPLLKEPWAGIIAFPPCTRLCLAGVQWLKERDLWHEMQESADFFAECLNAPAPHVACENPVMHRYAQKIVGKWDFTVQPYEFGSPLTKRTCFWTRNLPRLQPLPMRKQVRKTEARHDNHMMGPSDHRSQDRSRADPKLAAAMAEQWGMLTQGEGFLT